MLQWINYVWGGEFQRDTINKTFYQHNKPVLGFLQVARPKSFKIASSLQTRLNFTCYRRSTKTFHVGVPKKTRNNVPLMSKLISWRQLQPIKRFTGHSATTCSLSTHVLERNQKQVDFGHWFVYQPHTGCRIETAALNRRCPLVFHSEIRRLRRLSPSCLSQLLHYNKSKQPSQIAVDELTHARILDSHFNVVVLLRKKLL